MLELTNVGKQYLESSGEVVTALTEIDLKISPGELVAVVGPSGSGKSTLLQLAGALDSPTCGTVKVSGLEISELNERRRTTFRRDNVGFVFQAFHLVPSMTVIENVALSDIVRNRRRFEWISRSRELLEGVGLEQTAERLPHQLSGGQKQRVAVARALFSRPSLLLADEPTGNLDATSRDTVLRLIREGVDSSGTPVGMIVTHDPIAASYADRIVAVHDGRLAGEIDLRSTNSVLGEEDETRVERIRTWMATVPV